MHELRRSDVQVEGRLPAVYYGTIDATLLWISLLHDAWRWGHDPAEIEPLLPALEAALGWLSGHADPDGDVLAEDHNRALGTKDISHHPELKLAVWAARELDAATAKKTTMYTSCQPCGMCTGAIERSGLGGVVYALSGEELETMKPASASIAT